MAGAVAKEWNGADVRHWLETRIAAARSDQAVAVRAGRAGEDDCDKATAEEMVCSLVKSEKTTATEDAFACGLRALLDRDDYIWRGVYDDVRFDRHVRSVVRKLIRMTKANAGFENTGHYQ
jgi:hypothetical protein